MNSKCSTERDDNVRKLFAALLFMSLLCGCAAQSKPTKEEQITAGESAVIGVWISCYELDRMLDGGNFAADFAAAAEKIASFGATDAFVHMRAFSDSLFDSAYYPQKENAKRYGFDLPKYMIETLAKEGVRFHAWINPFRSENGGFLDPMDENVRKRILCGVREIAERYDISGVHFDDYFYPGAGDKTDAESFAAYESAAAQALSIDEYRRSTVTAFMFAAKSAAKCRDKNVVFSVSPAAGIEKNENSSFADVRKWCAEGAADWIIPQLYFGFEYPDPEYRFDRLLDKWKAVWRQDGVKLIVGLAAYKVKTATPPDADEWKDNGADVLRRQMSVCLGDGDVAGIALFSYSYLPDR